MTTYQPTAATLAATLDRAIHDTVMATTYGPAHARERGAALLALAERRMDLAVVRFGDDTVIPASAHFALDHGNALLAAGRFAS